MLISRDAEIGRRLSFVTTSQVRVRPFLSSYTFARFCTSTPFCTMSFESTLKLPEAGTPFSLPLAHPEPSAIPAPARQRTPEQDVMLKKLIDSFNAPDFKLPSTLDALKTIWRKREGSSGRGWFGGAPKDVVEKLLPLTEVEKCYWSSEVSY